MTRRRNRRAFGLALAALAFAGGGCGSPKYDVTGRVTYNGEVLDKPNGQIVFVGPGGEHVSAAIAPDGTYRAPLVPSGMNKVVVIYPNPKLKTIKGTKAKPGEAPPTVPPYLSPAKYATPETTDLTVTVDKQTVYDAPLTGPKIP